MAISNPLTVQKVYVRRSVAHVCVKGKTYGRLLQCTAISTAAQVNVSRSITDENKAIVSQTLPMGVVAEAWTLIEF